MEEALKQVPYPLVKVVLFGPESTGKTTLAQELAAHYKTLWVPEYAREYLQDKWDRVQRTCEPEDLLPIARGQMQLENDLSEQARELLICDTDLLETKVYSEAYYLGYCDANLEQHALDNHYDLYFLTYIDVPWEQDDLRDRPDKRREMFDYFKAALDQNGRKYVVLKGDRDERRNTAIAQIDKLLVMHRFKDQDKEQLQELGISPERAASQIGIFKQGIPYVALHQAAQVGNGIVKLNADEQEACRNRYRNALPTTSVLKFVPASGAASRMFKALFEFLEAFDPESDKLEEFLAAPKWKDVRFFKDHFTEFPFYNKIMGRISDQEYAAGLEVYGFIREMLSPEGLNYGFYPKGMLPFHRYENQLTTPFEEHLREGAAYACSQGEVRLHFTISEAHRELFETEYLQIRDRMQKETGCVFDISYSYQKAATDTLAVTPENEPFRDQSGRMLFRPGGHGALIENLEEQDADVLFIKNIDNVSVTSYQQVLIEWKEVLGGYLLEVQQEAFQWYRTLESGVGTLPVPTEIFNFLEQKLNVCLPNGLKEQTPDEQRAFILDRLNRPLRVCGMVKNEGEPGGGPFWVKDSEGGISLQIVESAQVDLSNTQQQDIFNGATHFNPVDLVCGVRNASGAKYDLTSYVDPTQGFITEKTYEGRNLKALELPGLWNGAMARWNTIFVEVPVDTFNPVKTVNDLLKPAHRN